MTDSTDMQSKIAAKCAEYLDRRTEWDEPPALLGLFAEGDQGLRLERFPLPLEMWEMGPAGVMLGRYAQLVVESEMEPIPDLVAVAFRCEAFALRDDASPQAEEVIRRRMAGGSAPRNADVPGRVEQRMLSAVDTNGRHYMTTADRLANGSAAPAATEVFTDEQDPTGSIPAALDRLIAALRPQPTPSPTSN
ncbi:hypothetical protein AB0C11_33670 [Streptomyces sp. NPDC039016]|uniref:hypothetical protein n=1 Tax=Streptomyces sp. NPDC039016 TaxID=3154330 RepID=UPI0033C8320C